MAKVVLVGYGQMLYSLIEGIKAKNHIIAGVFRTDRIKYSPFELFLKDIFNPSYDYTIIKSNKLYDIKAKSVNDESFRNEIKRLNPDLIIVGSWAEKFKEDILKLKPCINFHPALLPKNRGANPYFWTIYLNQTITGLTAHYMDKNFDTDENETGASLKEKTTKLARTMVGNLLDLFDKKQLQPIKQNEALSSYEHQLTNKEIIVDLNRKKEEVSRHIRALTPWSVPYVKLYRSYIKIPKYEFLEIDEKTKDKKTYEIIQNNKKFFVLKGSDFLIKIYK